MLFFATIFSLLVAGVMSINRECLGRETEECVDPIDVVKEFPQTKESMDTACRVGIKYLDCLKVAYRKCDADEEELRLFGRTIYYLESELCNEHSDIYQVVSSNLPCIKKTMDSVRNSCSSEYVHENLAKFSDQLGLSHEGSDEPEMLTSCMHGLLDTACKAAIMGEACGGSVERAFLSTAANINPRLSQCPADVIKQLPYASEALQAVAQAENKVENAIKRRRK